MHQRRKNSSGFSKVAAGILPAVKPWLPARRKNHTYCQRATIFMNRKARRDSDTPLPQVHQHLVGVEVTRLKWLRP